MRENELEIGLACRACFFRCFDSGDGAGAIDLLAWLLHPFCECTEQARKFGLARDLEEKLGAVTTDNFDDNVGHLTIFIILDFGFGVLFREIIPQLR